MMNLIKRLALRLFLAIPLFVIWTTTGALTALGAQSAKSVEFNAAKGGDDLISFYHATSKAGAESIGANGINLSAGRARVDFGQGFYTTIDQAQASAWAAKKFGTDAAVLEFRVSRSALEGISNLNMGAATESSLFRFFRHNRLGGRLHSYDTVSGPMLGYPGSFLRGGTGTTFGQQTSWHTQSAADMLWNGLVR